ncbi:MAG: hypothetical protein WC792_05735 [Candidatus Micrarchaeia archaeon]|jgi:hypothetical protein
MPVKKPSEKKSIEVLLVFHADGLPENGKTAWADGGFRCLKNERRGYGGGRGVYFHNPRELLAKLQEFLDHEQILLQERKPPHKRVDFAKI